jgi:hypothetical protein
MHNGMETIKPKKILINVFYTGDIKHELKEVGQDYDK